MKRTIAAILAADVAGFSRLVAEDEDDTLRRLQDYSRVFRAEVTRVGGRVFNTAGDAILAEFPSAVEALRAGIAIQEQMQGLNADHPPERRILFRMGLNIGDVIETDAGDMLGDGVNVAARLEGLAEPGGICLSRSVHEAIAARLTVAFRDIGPQTLKNIPRPIHAFRVVLPWDGPGETVKARRRWPRLVGVSAALLLLLAGGLAMVFRDDLYGRTEGSVEAEPLSPVAAREALERADLLSVAVVHPQRACFKEAVWLSGTIVPRSEAEVSPDEDGLRILRVFAKPLDKVAQGQALAELARPDQPGQAVVTLRAPVAGSVGQSQAHVGALTARVQALFKIIPQGTFELAAEVPVKSLPILRAGQSVAVTPLGLPEIAGRVRSVSAEIDGATQLGRARVSLVGHADLRQGQFARGVATIGERCGIGLPESAILRSAEGSVVFVSNQGHVEGRFVTTGLSANDAVEIRSGLDGGEAVLLRAGPFVREGDLVNALPTSDRASN
ncbi:HlyD family efflux transporter periplasmic adaptor subunit [Methylobacterium gnaphalii]|uniref:Guanylate cyclase domain-containing protein n=1 Tax=Methylobacterium gnaphalii TaxID=1010610 RepID=A0A512JLC6_9HYPH|nr:HlyD family efflux transporter periplasmic adaptor subunit [Methylobacterium gnaphalii]GEP10765.1 hypothetical protein MGN01_26100 [Methylobacterium gnaphalii]GJD67364.1 hypothetical protein MMMDOFMJ_0279 [Methylobacterium gnaphalii]GLS49304.1 hypothetical protein GCM10007885_21520 [Methylobacterium gnaphalii]